jgi:ketosteroid isomerase-like protein
MMPSSPEQNLSIVKALYEATGRGEWAQAEAHLTDDFFITEASTLPFAGVYRGRDALRELYTKVMATLDVAVFAIQEITAGGDHVVVLLNIVLAGEPSVHVAVAEMFRFRDSKVCEIKPFYFDPTLVVAATKSGR